LESEVALIGSKDSTARLAGQDSKFVAALSLNLKNFLQKLHLAGLFIKLALQVNVGFISIFN